MIHVDARHMESVQEMLRRHLPNAEIWAFGSRVTGRHKPFSDLDLVIRTKPEPSGRKLALLETELSESDLPFRVDVLSWSVLPKQLRRSIEEEHEIVQFPAQDG